MDMVRIDCGTCAVRGPACGDCMVTALLGPDELLGPQQGVMELEGDEVSALRAMSEAGLLPPLRLVRAVSPGSVPDLYDRRIVSGRGVV